MGWISVENETPKLPNYDYCSVTVNTWTEGENRSVPMIYERAVVRGKRTERWKYCWGRIADKAPDFWMPLPKPPGQTTNADRIRAMTDEEFSYFLCDFRTGSAGEHHCAGCKAEEYCRTGHNGMIEWLQQLAKED